MMTQDEFIKRINAVPWVDRGVSWEGVDCYGLVMMYYRYVMGVILPVPDGYYEKDKLDKCWFQQEDTGLWQQVKRPTENGLIFTAYHIDTPAHVGVTIDRFHVMHADGNYNGGKVNIHKISALERFYGKVTFHKYIGLSNGTN